MSNKKISSIDWLVEQIDNKDMGEVPMWIYDFCEQAKEMHKEEIVEAFNEGALDTLPFGEQYYEYVYEVK
jgi:hypothetical protein